MLLAEEGRTTGDFTSADRGELPRHWGILARVLADRERRGVASSVSDKVQRAGLRGCAEDGEKVLLRCECSAVARSRFSFTYCVGSKRGGLAGADAGRELQALGRGRGADVARGVSSEAARPTLSYSCATERLITR
jgi:hypothetical protein